MASIRKQKKTWFACVTLGDGTRTQRSTRIKDQGTPKERADNKRRAITIAQEYEEAASGNRTEAQIRKSMGDLYSKVNKKRMEFASTDTFLGNWLKRVEVRKSEGTNTRYSQVVRDFLDHLGKRRSCLLSDITPDDIQSFIDGLILSGIKGNTPRNIMKALNVPFAHAQRQGIILTNPVAGSDMPDGASESKTPFSPKQVQGILDASEGDWKQVVMLGFYEVRRCPEIRVTQTAFGVSAWCKSGIIRMKTQI